MNITTRSLILGALTLVSIEVAANALYIYPANGQDGKTEARDRYECYVFASQRSAYDPTTGTQPPVEAVKVRIEPNSRDGATLAGTIVGAAAGAVITGDSEGAAAGAIAGTVVGAVIENDGNKRVRDQATEKAESILKEQDRLALQADEYRRLFSQCMTERQYVVR